MGTGQDAGIPQMGCSCKNCEAARWDPSRRRAGASLALVDTAGEKFYLVDASLHMSGQVDRLLHTHVIAGLGALQGIFITHAHMGHIIGLSLLGKEAADVKRVTVFAALEVCEFLGFNPIFRRMVQRGNLRLGEILEGEALELFEGATITPFVVPHRKDAILTYGYLITEKGEGDGKGRTIIYIPDMDLITKEIKALVKDSDIALLDGTFFDMNELPGRDMSEISHPLIEETIRTLGEMDTRIIFTHINHSNPVSDPSSKEYEHVTEAGHEIASEGLVLSLRA